MSEEEIIKHIKTLNEITKKNNKKGIVVGLEISTDMADKLLNLIEKQEKEIIEKCEKIDSLERDIGEYILEKEKQDKMIDLIAEDYEKYLLRRSYVGEIIETAYDIKSRLRKEVEKDD